MNPAFDSSAIESVYSAGELRAPHFSPSELSLPLASEESKEDDLPSSQLLHQHNSSGRCNRLFIGNSEHNTMMFNSDGDKSGESHTSKTQQTVDRLKMLYPNVNEDETPLPRCWSAHDKCLAIGLSNNNLRVRYKGAGKQHNEAASVRTAHPIPATCGLYYFEVKIISKGKNGYMGIGLTAQQFRMNRLPGWDKQSYGYHGDDGNSFSSSGNGQSYGPTFTTGDIIGCCIDFKHNLCFYTKNGVHLGTAFRDLPSKLYPTVGLQTPGEEVDANFGQEPFKYEQIEDLMKQMRSESIAFINNLPLPAEPQTPMGDPTSLLHKWVSSYLVHNGYSSTAEAFVRSTGQQLEEDLDSIKNRQKIMKLVMAGKMGQAIMHTLNSYPGVLENNKNLLFMLKCRQFIEMVNGSDVEFCPTNKSAAHSASTAINSSTQTPPPNQTSVIQSTKSYQNGSSGSPNTSNTLANTSTLTTVIPKEADQSDLKDLHADESSKTAHGDEDGVPNYFNDVEMEIGHNTNGKLCKNENTALDHILDSDEDMDVDLSPSSSRNPSSSFERILEFGKELSQMGQVLEKENKLSSEDRQMLEDAFSLIAYSNPWSSPLGWQLCPSKREAVCSALNSAILESMNQPWRSPLEVCVSHASELLKVMARSWLGAGAFVSIDDVFSQN